MGPRRSIEPRFPVLPIASLAATRAAAACSVALCDDRGALDVAPDFHFRHRRLGSLRAHDGDVPFTAESLPELCLQVMSAEATRLTAKVPSLPGGLEAAVFWTTDRNPRSDACWPGPVDRSARPTDDHMLSAQRNPTNSEATRPVSERRAVSAESGYSFQLPPRTSCDAPLPDAHRGSCRMRGPSLHGAS